MATCPADALIAANPCLLELSDVEMRTVQFGAIANWAKTNTPGLDTSLPTLMAQSACFMELSDAQLQTLIFAQLCKISGG